MKTENHLELVRVVGNINSGSLSDR